MAMYENHKRLNRRGKKNMPTWKVKGGKRRRGIGYMNMTEQLYMQLLSFAKRGEIKQEPGRAVFEIEKAKLRIGLYESMNGFKRYEDIPEYGSGWRILRLTHEEVKDGASWGIIRNALEESK